MVTSKSHSQKPASNAAVKVPKKAGALQQNSSGGKENKPGRKTNIPLSRDKALAGAPFTNSTKEVGDNDGSNSEPSQAENKIDNAKKTINMNGIGDLIGNASNIVLKAAGILETEIARGIVAAKQVEEKYSDMPKIRGGEIISNRQFDDLFVRFRKDAHDILDLIVDFTAIAAQNANKVTNHFIKIGGNKLSRANNTNQQVPFIQVPGELKAGQQTNFPVTLENDNTDEAKTIMFVSSPLTDASGNQLNGTALTFSPNPLTIQPSSTGNVTVIVNIPADAKPGSYNSFIQAQNAESLRATLMVKVV